MMATPTGYGTLEDLEALAERKPVDEVVPLGALCVEPGECFEEVRAR